jgi:hypothetical protein
MPYIKPELRIELDYLISRLIEEVSYSHHNRDGVLNYIISSVCAEGIKGIEEQYQYKTLNSLIGVFECAKLECYRRLVAPYEDKAIEKNGDIASYG